MTIGALKSCWKFVQVQIKRQQNIVYNLVAVVSDKDANKCRRLFHQNCKKFKPIFII